MRRPLAWLCLLSVISMTVVHSAEERKSVPPPLLTGEKIQSTLGEKETVAVTGTVTEALATSAGECLSVNQISIQSKNRSDIILSPEMKLTITIEGRAVLPDDRITVKGTFAAYDGATNPGQFDAARYYASLDTVGTLRNAEIRAVEPGGPGLVRLLASLRFSLLGCYERIMDEKTAGTVAAICLGEKKMMEREWKQVYQDGGIAHILAVSGLHISMAGMGLFRLLRRLRMGYRTSSLVSGLTAVLYTMLTGAAISAVRACLMFLLWLGAQSFGRKSDMLTGISAAAVLLTGADRRNLPQSSFLLSFSAVLSLCILPRLAEEVCAIRSRAAKAVTAGASVWIGTLPCTLWFFYQAAPWSILVNLAVVPLMSAVMASGLAASAGLLWEPAGIFFAAPAGYLLNGFEWLCRLEQNFPVPLWVAGRPGLFSILLYYSVLAALCLIGTAVRRKGKRDREKKSRTKGMRALWISGCFVCIACMGRWKSGELTVTCLDVGQGDCTLLQFPEGINCLVDGGSSSNRKVWEYVISQSVKYYGIRKIDYWFLSHADEDHISGLREFLTEYQTGRWKENVSGITLERLVLPPSADDADFDELTALAGKNGIEILQMDRGDTVGRTKPDRTGDAGTSWSMTCLAPQKGGLAGDRNEDSMVLLLEYGNFRMLFTGDLEGAAEKKLAASGADLHADVLKVGHHGSSNGSSEEFLEAVSPRFAVISCGKNNRYGHPSDETLGRLDQEDAAVFRTDECGAVTFRTDGEQYTAGTFLQSADTN